jgi:hypothetical protein
VHACAAQERKQGFHAVVVLAPEHGKVSRAALKVRGVGVRV